MYHERDYAALTNVMQEHCLITSVRTLAERLVEIREEADLTQEQLATEAGVTQGTIANAESGARKLPREYAAIALACGVNPEWLKSEKGPKYAITGTASTGQGQSTAATGTVELAAAAKASASASATLSSFTLVSELARRISAIPRDQRDPIRQEVAALVMSPDSEETRAALTHYLTFGDERLPTTTEEMINKNRVEKNAAKPDTNKDTVRN